MSKTNDIYNEFALHFARLNYQKPTHWDFQGCGTNCFICVEYGEVSVTIENKTLTAKEGQAIFMPPTESNIITQFHGVPFSGYDLCFRFFPNTKAYQYPFQMIELDETQNQLIKEIPIKEPITSTMVWRFYKCLQYLQTSLKQYEHKHFSTVTLALEFMEKNDVYDVPTLAAHCNLKESQFYNVFMQITGKTPIQEKQRIQAQKAEYLLKHTDLSIKEIAKTLNYQSESHFRKVFRSRYHMSPNAFRKN